MDDDRPCFPSIFRSFSKTTSPTSLILILILHRLHTMKICLHKKPQTSKHVKSVLNTYCMMHITIVL